MKFKIGFFAVMLGMALLWEHSLFSLAAALAVFLHEMGHIGAAYLCGIRFNSCKIGIYGAGLVPDDGLYSYKKEIVLCLAGPLINLMCGCCFGIAAWKSNSVFLSSFVFASFSLGVLNLLPIRDFDGGRILNALLCFWFTPNTASKTVRGISFGLVFLLWLLSVYFLLRAKTSLSLFVFSLSLFGKIFIADFQKTY